MTTIGQVLQRILDFFSRYPQSPWEYLLWMFLLFIVVMVVIFATVWAMNYFDNLGSSHNYYSHEPSNGNNQVRQDYFFTIGESGDQFYMLVMPSGRIQSLQINGIPINSAGLTFSRKEMSFVIMRGERVMLSFVALKLSEGEFQVINIVENHFNSTSTQNQT